MADQEMRKQCFVSGLFEGQKVEDVFLVAANNRAETKAGKPYLILTLMDKTGEIGGRLWDNVDQFEQEAEVGKLVLVTGVAQSFREELQVKVDLLKKVADDAAGLALADFLPSCSRPATEMKEELKRIIGSIVDPGLRKLLQNMFKGNLLEEFALAPAAKKMHHAYLGGLIEHTLSMASLAERIAGHYPTLDRDIFLAGALVHDLGKVREFSYSRAPFEYTDSGRLLGHMILGCEMVREHAKSIKELSGVRLEQLLHLILSHHGRHEFGSPVLPMTLEAILLHHVDDIDAKVNYINGLTEKIDTPGQQWSDYQRPLERFLLLSRQEAESQDTESFETAFPLKKGDNVKQKAVKSSSSDFAAKQQSLF